MLLKQLLNELVERGSISAETEQTVLTNPPISQTDVSRVWYIRFLSGFSAWIAALLFATALGIVDLLQETGPRFVIGLLLVVIALLVRRRSDPSQIFRTQLTLSVSLLGQGLMIASAFESLDERLASLFMFAMATLLFLIYPDPLHRFLTALIALGGLYALVAFIEFEITNDTVEIGVHLVTVLLLVGAIWLWLHAHLRWRTPLVTLPAVYALPLSYALPIALLVALLVTSLLPQQSWILSLGAIVCALAVVYRISAETQAPKLGQFFLVLTLMVGVLTFTEPGVIAALSLLVLGFARGDRVLMLLSASTFLFFISRYYYRLDITLLNKSFVLMLTGVVLLAAWAALRTQMQPKAASTPEVVA